MSAPASRSGPLPLVGRDRELGILREHLNAALAGQGSLVLVSGEAGIGKTTLVEAICHEAADRGALILVGHSYDLTETPPYGPWVELFARYRSIADVPPLPIAFAERGTVGEVASQAALSQQVLDFLAALTALRPVVVMLDDAHWADAASLDLLRYLARSVSTLRLLCVVTYRSDELTRRHSLYQLLPLLVRESGAQRVDLHALDNDAVRSIVARQYFLTLGDCERLVTYLQGRAEGNALFLRELLHSLEETGTLRPGDPYWVLDDVADRAVPPLLRQVIDGRLVRLGDEAQSLLAVAAVIGQEVPFELWASVAETGEGALFEAVSQAQAAHLMVEASDGMGANFSHALIREALYEGTRPSQRRRWHQQVGEILAAHPYPDPDAVSGHFQRAGDSRAVIWLLRAADRAQRAYAWLTAADRLDAVLALIPEHNTDAAERGWLLYRLAGLRFYADPMSGIPVLDDAIRYADEATDRALAAAARFQRGFQRFWGEDMRAGIADMEAGIAASETLSGVERMRLDAIVASGTLIEVHSERAMHALFLAHVGRYSEALTLAGGLLAETAAHELGLMSYADAHKALALAYTSFGQPSKAHRAFARARTAYQRLGHQTEVAINAYRELEWVALPYQADNLTERLRIGTEAEEAWSRTGGLQPDVPPRAMQLPLLFLQGEWVEIERIGNVFLFARYHTSVVVTMARLFRARGDAARLQSLVAATLPEGPATEPGGSIFRNVVTIQRLAAELAIDMGEYDAARAWLETHDRWLAWNGSKLDGPEGRLAWAMYHRATSDRSTAYDCATDALTRASTLRQPLALLAAHRLLGELDAAAGDLETAADRLDEALHLANACAAPYERALTLLALADLLTRERRSDEALSALMEARTICAPLDARLSLARADALAARLTAIKDIAVNPAGLSTREVEVLRLVAAGRSNREIAETLFLSEHTVRHHLTHILAKTNAANRAEAAAFALRHGLA